MKKINEILRENKNILREPLLYLLPLLVLVGFLAIPSKSNISNVVLTVDGNSYPESFPVLTSKIGEHSYFSISFNIDVKDNKKSVYKFYPDDCILGVEINGKTFPQEEIKEPCDYMNGTVINLSEYTRKGLNKIEFQMGNIDGFGGLRIESPSSFGSRFTEFQINGLKVENSRSVGFGQILFFALLLIIFVLVLRKFKLSNETVLACVLTFPFVIYAFVDFCVMVNHEFSGIVTEDTAIYYAVGRGIANGIAPWSGLFDIKPPGIFLVSAISFKFFDSPIFIYYFQAFALILIAAVPVAAYFLLSNYRSVLKLALSLLAGLLFALYSAEKAGEFQTESLGAAFACIAVFAMATPDFEKRKILWTSLAAIGLLGACGFKEPFLFPLIGVSLIFCKDIREWISRFALPLAIAVSLGFVFLLVCGWLDSFLNYLKFMSSTHIFKFGSPFRRAMEFNRIYENMNNFSWGFAIAVLALLSLPFVNPKSNGSSLFIKVVLLGVAFFLSCYSVGVGGEFFQHHFIFAVPFYMALVLLLLKEWNGGNSAVVKLGLVSFVFLAIATLNLPDRDLAGHSKIFIENYINDSQEAAVYLDKKMDELGIDRYAFVGFNYVSDIYGFTRHSPMGPYFNQQAFWWKLGAGDSLIANIKKADIVVVGSTAISEFTPPMLDSIYGLLNEQFTEREQINHFQIYFRKK